MSDQLSLSASPARDSMAAQHIRPGDFTHVTGYRRVARVDLHPRKRTVRIHWTHGAQTFDYDTTLKVSRP